MSHSETNWISVCDAAELEPMLGVRALVGKAQVAIFRVNDEFFGLDAIDPFSKAAILARGIVGDLKQQLVVASPLYKQHFNLKTGECLEDPAVKVKTYAVREQDGKIQVAVGTA